jgi:hypothetical protein
MIIVCKGILKGRAVAGAVFDGLYARSQVLFPGPIFELAKLPFGLDLAAPVSQIVQYDTEIYEYAKFIMIGQYIYNSAF